MGFGIAVTIRIGQFVGANKSTGPKGTAFVGLTTLGGYIGSLFQIQTISLVLLYD